MYDIQKVKQQLQVITELLPELGEVTAGLLGLHAYKTTPGRKNACIGKTSPIEKELFEREHTQGMLTSLTLTAAKWGWDPKEKIMPCVWMCTNLEKVEKHLGVIPDTDIETINRVAVALTNLVVKPVCKVLTRQEALTVLYTRARQEAIYVSYGQAAKLLRVGVKELREKVKSGIGKADNGLLRLDRVLELTMCGDAGRGDGV